MSKERHDEICRLELEAIKEIDSLRTQLKSVEAVVDLMRPICLGGANSDSYVEQSFRNKCKRAIEAHDAFLNPTTDKL